jgi:hypothetical protein
MVKDFGTERLWSTAEKTKICNLVSIKDLFHSSKGQGFGAI